MFTYVLNVPVSVYPSKEWVFPAGRQVCEVCHQSDVGRFVGAGHVAQGFGHGGRVDGQVSVEVDGDAQVEQRPAWTEQWTVVGL